MREATDTRVDQASNEEDAVAPILAAFARSSRARGAKYLWLHAAISECVDRGELRPGARLPSEESLAHRLSLSVGTVQKAMQALREDGLLERRQGAGTFIVDPSIDFYDLWHFCFLADDGESYLPLTAKALAMGCTSDDGPWRRHMPDVANFVTVRRLINVNGEFQILSDFYFNGDRFGDLADLPLSAFDRIVLRNLLSERYAVRTKSARQHLQCASISAEDCKLLKLRAGAVGITLETFGRDFKEAPIYYQRVVIPQNDRRLVIDK